MYKKYLSLYTRPGRFDLLKQLRDNLEDEISTVLEGIPHIDRISFRVKKPDSFAQKAVDPDITPPYTDPLVEIEDQVAGRIIVFYLEDIDIVKDKLFKNLITIEQKHKRPSKDYEFGYESHHMICTIPILNKPDGWDSHQDFPPTFEIQVRTIFMHAYAEPQHNWVYKKAEDLPSPIRKQLGWIAASSWGADEAYQRVWSWYVTNIDKLRKN